MWNNRSVTYGVNNWWSCDEIGISGDKMDREEFLKQMLKYSASAGNIEANIMNMLDYIGRKLEADRTYIFEKNKEGNSDNTYEWCSENAIPQKDQLQNVEHDGLMDAWYDIFANNKGVLITDLEEYKEVNLSMYELLKPQDIHSLIAWPIFVDEICIGFLGIDNPQKKHMEDVSRILEMVGFIMSIIIRQRDNVRILRRLSYEDQLTGVKNRRELDKFIKNKYPKVSSVGVLSCDLNGLKDINDTLGHEAGDKYIIRAAENLVKIFGRKYVYRMGGDEFVALDINLSAAEFELKVKKVLELMDKDKAPVATGYVFSADNKTDFYSLMDEADKRMYEDKEKYYSNTKHERRRSTI